WCRFRHRDSVPNHHRRCRQRRQRGDGERRSRELPLHMSITAYNDLLQRLGAGYWLQQPFWDEITTATGALGGALNVQKLGLTKTLPSLPSGVTAYMATSVCASVTGANQGGLLIAKLINLGSLNIATPTFTDGSAFPTVTELGASNSTWGPVFVEVTTAL